MFSNSQKVFLLIFAVCVFLILAASAVSYYYDIKPCLLCLLQRYAFILVALIALLAVVVRPKAWGIKVYSALLFLASSLGVALAVRQVYLQSLPSSLHRACLPDMNYLINAVGVFKALKMMVLGSSDCALVHWNLLGLSMAGWAIVWFVVLAALSVRLFFTNPRAN